MVPDPHIHFCVTTRTYNSSGAQPTNALVGKVLTMQCPDFGRGMKEVDISIFFASRHGICPHKSLQSEFEVFHSVLTELPRLEYVRRQSRVILAFQSQAACAEDEAVKNHAATDLGLFAEVFHEVLSHLRELKAIVQPRDEFHIDEFLDWLETTTTNLPKSPEALIILQSKAEAHAFDLTFD